MNREKRISEAMEEINAALAKLSADLMGYSKEEKKRIKVELESIEQVFFGFADSGILEDMKALTRKYLDDETIKED